MYDTFRNQLNISVYTGSLFSYNIMLRCWNFEPEQRPTFEDLKNELDTMLSADHRDQCIRINLVDEPFCKMFPPQNNEV